MGQNDRKPNLWKGMMVGLIAGVVGSWTMNRFQDVWVAASSSDNSKKREERSNASENEQNSVDDATVKAASAVSNALFDHKLTAAEKKIAGPAIHYAVGAAAGAVYGVASEYLPQLTAGFGLPYGTVFWLVVDESVVPLLRLAKGPAEYPLSTHAYALASHLVFGATVEGTRRLLRD
jgi:uncharacterized membrane protein YagU involved in acid resistance